MKLKTSFFNKTIFWKNVTLYWPLWGLYSLVLLIGQPIVLWLNSYYNGFMAEAPTKTERLRELIDRLYMEPYIWIIMVAAILFGMALFSYLYNSKSANMIHSLPVNRKELFGTNVISGLVFLIVPLITTGIFTLIIGLFYGIPDLGYIGIWLLMVIAIAVIFFSVVTICAMFTGLILTVPFYVFVANAISYWVYGLVYFVIAVFGYGVVNFGYGSMPNIGAIISFLSPFICILNGVCIDWSFRFDDTGYSREFVVDITGAGILIVYVLVAVLLYFLAYRVYKKRQIEQAGEFLTVSWLKPFFRWGAGVTGGIFGGLLVKEVSENLDIRCNLVAFLVIMLILGGMCYFFADMFVKKSFHVFKKKNWIGCGKFAVTLLVTFFALFGYAKYQERYIPDTDDIEFAEISMDYSIEFWGEDVDKVVQIHERIMENISLCSANQHRWDVDYTNVRIYYSLKNGDYVSRRYRIPIEAEELKPVLDEIITMQSDPEIFIESHFIPSSIKNPAFSTGYVEFAYGDEQNECNYKCIDLNSIESQKIYEAALADAKAGALIKYNMDRYGYYEEDYSKYNVDCEVEVRYSSAYFYVSYYDPDVPYGSSGSVALSFGPDCENIINALIELEIIESADEIIWQ